VNKLLNSGQVGNFSFKDLSESRRAHGRIHPLSAEWDINYHKIRYSEEIMYGNPSGACHHLGKMIEYMYIKLMKDHCG